MATITKLIGYGISKGTFTTDHDEKIDYDNILLRMISNEGLKETDHGFMSVAEQKVKREILAKSFSCAPDEVALFLDSVLGQEVELKFGIINGKPLLTGLIFKETSKK